MNNRTLLFCALLVPVLSLLPSALAQPDSAHLARYELDKRGALRSLAVGRNSVALDAALGGFSARDVVAGAAFDLSKGKLVQRDGRSVYDASASGIRVHAEFVPHDGYVQVNGYLEKSTPEDRAIILDYRVGLTGPDAVFSNGVNRFEEAKVSGSDTEEEGNAFPVAAMQTKDRAIALAIRYDAPCSFGMVGSAQGLAVRFYLGVTADTRAFPNRAPFAFVMYPTEPGWGFRSALERYYSFFPEHYEPRELRTGYWLFQVKGIEPEGIEQYTYNLFEIQTPHVQFDLDRDDRYDIATQLYTLVGQREIKFLDKLPTSYEEAMKVFDHWSVESHKKHPVTKENVVTGEDQWLREEVKSSAATLPDGRYHIQFRDTPWGKKSVTFKANPSPHLFEDQPEVQTVGRNSIRLIENWLKEYPQIDGVLVDSMGANWPATPNYRRDHFAYTRHPVTFDAQGRLFTNNAIGHYEWCKELGDKLWAQGKTLTANGLYAYKAANLEHYRNPDRRNRPKLGRFFVSSLLDACTSEAGIRAGTDRCQDVRIMMGRKYCTLTNYHWEDENEVRQFYNRSLAYAIFASNTMTYAGGGEYIENVHEGIPYMNNPEGYGRDKELIDWLLPKATMLQKAGWQPVTYAEVESADPKVFIERFGSGPKFFLTLFNDSMERKECIVKVDLDSLGADALDYRELAYSAKLEKLSPDRVKLTLEPHQAYMIAASRIWEIADRN